MKNPNPRDLYPSRTLTISIQVDPRKVYEFVRNPENLPKWATAFCRSAKRVNGDWIVETTLGPVKFEFFPDNKDGVMDHLVHFALGAKVYVPMRVIPNGVGSEVLITLYRTPDMDDARWAEDARLVERDLKTLKFVVEG